MTIAFVNVAAAAHIGTTPVTPAYPATPVAGRIFVCFVGNKGFGVTPTTPALWTQQTTGTSGSVAAGISTGSVRATGLTTPVLGTESGTLSITTTSAVIASARMGQYSKTLDVWQLAGTTLSDTDETGTGVSATGSSIPIGASDFLVLWVSIKDDVPNHTSQVLSVPGCTLGAITWQTKDSTGLGSDGGGYYGHCAVTAGSSSGAPTYTATSSVSGASSTAVAVVRLREATASFRVGVPYMVRREAIRRSFRW